MFVSFDDELAEAAFVALNAEGQAAARLAVVLDWYRIALSNAEAVTLEVRVGATRSALEILLEEDLIGELAGAYCRLVSEPDVSKMNYTKEQCGWGGGVLLSDNGFWLARLNKLRNAIVHGDGDSIPDDLWEYGGHPQIDHIHDRLIEALRAYLAAESDDPLLRMEPGKRLPAAPWRGGPPSTSRRTVLASNKERTKGGGHRSAAVMSPDRTGPRWAVRSRGRAG